MRRYRKGQIFRPPTAAESAAYADAVEAHRARPEQPQDISPSGQTVIVKTHEDGIPGREDTTVHFALCKRCIQIVSGSTKTIVPTDEIVIVHNFMEAYVPGDIYVATALTECEIRYVAPLSATVTGMLKTSLTPGGTATMYLTNPDGTIIDDTTPLVVTVKDTIGDKRAIGKDDRSAGGAMCTAEYLGDGTCAIKQVHQQARMMWGTTTGLVNTTDSTFEVSSLTAMDGGMVPEADSGSNWTVQNTVDKFSIASGVQGKIILDVVSGNLHPYDFACCEDCECECT